MRKIARTVKGAAKKLWSLLFVCLVLAVSACSAGGPSKRELRKIATSTEVQKLRDQTKRTLHDRVREIESGVPWLRPLSVVTADTCSDTRGNSHLFDPNPPKKQSMICGINAYIIFSSKKRPVQVVKDVRSAGVTEWTQSSIDDIFDYYGKNKETRSSGYRPSLSTSYELSISESLSWDDRGRPASMHLSKKSLWSEITRRYSNKSIEELREDHGTIYIWTLHGGNYFKAT
ncbi:hypothetical protein [Streptomyces halobius]|uniref:Lipoprotein n=1 Tax=Streptomyces halobius TaxID=2879846 RepID=A0ABY4MFX4_9ACTN|nr:hypothetical protein [Streptomyces halobius]UQA96709.1 hypothetical protein K9S39_36895 [Streptomyces halobius]